MHPQVIYRLNTCLMQQNINLIVIEVKIAWKKT